MKNSPVLLIAFSILQVTATVARAQSSYADGQDIEPTDVIYDGNQVAIKDPVGLVTVHLEDTVNSKGEALKGIALVSCSGTLIASDVVLTAGHCVDGIKKYGANVELTVKYRGLDGSTKSTVMKDYKIYPGYQNNGVAAPNDLALIRIKDPIQDRKPVQLAGAADLNDGESLITAGYGLNEKGQLTRDDLLSDPIVISLAKQYNALPDSASGKIKKQHLAEQLAKRVNDLNESRLILLSAIMRATVVSKGKSQMLQIQSSTVSVCEGDSGGPTLKKIDGKLIIVGVHSGSTDANCKVPSGGFLGWNADEGLDVYVPIFTTWIKKQVMKWHQEVDL